MPVDAQRGRCGLAPLPLSAAKRSEPNTSSNAPSATCALAIAALPLRSSRPSLARRASISASTREMKNDATEWMVLRSRPAASAVSRPVR